MFEKKKNRVKIIMYIVSIAVVLFLGISSFTMIKNQITLNYFIKKGGDKAGTIIWEDKGPTPLAEKKFPPQGLTWVDGMLIFANSWKNERSRVYEIDPATMQVLRYFDMPKEAVHTSGLAWDGDYLWAVDYISHKAYCIELEPSLSQSTIKLKGSFATNLKGTSACCIVPYKDKNLLAISDFKNTKKTYLVRMYAAMEAGTMEDAVELAYQNEGLSQGLEFFNGHLYESENKFGRNIINKMDLKLLEKTRDAKKSTVKQYKAPSWGVEDLAWDGHYLWTSDETKYRFYKGSFKDEP